MNQGQSWQAAVTSVGLPISRATAYRWQRRVQLEGEAALDDQRHGHVYKLREPLRRWLVSSCQQVPYTPSHLLQQVPREQFNVTLSIGYLNEVRLELQDVPDYLLRREIREMKATADADIKQRQAKFEQVFSRKRSIMKIGMRRSSWSK